MKHDNRSSEDKADLLIQKHDFLLKVKGVDSKTIEEVVAQIYYEDPTNLEFKLKHITNLFEKQSVWRALTEFMRFEAETISYVESMRPKEQFDV